MKGIGELIYFCLKIQFIYNVFINELISNFPSCEIQRVNVNFVMHLDLGSSVLQQTQNTYFNKAPHRDDFDLFG